MIASFVLHVLFLVALLIVAWVLFLGWLVWAVLRGILRLLGLIGRGGGSGPPNRCPRFRCGASNPPAANFCRRCGTPLRVSSRWRVAA
ncbi:MAG: zinc ribbon domain-containing protein [Tepidisphaeraceae bacterium]|jgi:hypothetical protein